MNKVYSGTDFKKIDDYSINVARIPSLVLMERAAYAVYQVVTDKIKSTDKICVVAMNGNNGADGIALARMLHTNGFDVEVYRVSPDGNTTEECQKQIEIAKNLSVKFVKQPIFNNYDVIIDAIFGIGLAREITGKISEVISSINNSYATVFAVDIPSGVNSDNGKIEGIAVKADYTVTFGSYKIGHIAYPGKTFCGQVSVREVGFAPQAYNEIPSNCYTLTLSDLELWPKRKERSNKGTYGKILIIAGSKEMSGAAYFSANAAMRMGAGLVNIMTAKENIVVLKEMIPEAVFTPYDTDNPDFENLYKVIDSYEYIVIGPGIAKGSTVTKLLTYVLNKEVATVIDADALNLISKNPHLKNNLHKKCVLTPHMGEMSRLTDKCINEISGNPFDTAKKFSKEYNVVCVLKDANTITAAYGTKCYINTSGNNGMSTAGSGDVLTGIIAAALACGLDIDVAAALGVYIHGLAGDESVKNTGQLSLMARDILKGIDLIANSTNL